MDWVGIVNLNGMESVPFSSSFPFSIECSSSSSSSTLCTVTYNMYCPLNSSLHVNFSVVDFGAVV